MKSLRQNIWFIFWLVTIAGLLTFGLYSVSMWKATKTHYRNLQETRVELFSAAFTAYFENQFSLLDTVGYNLAEKGALPPEPVISPLLDWTLEKNPDFLAMAFMSPDGDPKYITSNFDLSAHEERSGQPERRRAFQLVRDSEKVKTGNTLVSRISGEAVLTVPIHRVIFEPGSDTNPLGAMTAGVGLSSMPGFHQNSLLDEISSLEVLRGDGYYQYSSTLSPRDYASPARDDYIAMVEDLTDNNGANSYSGAFYQSVLLDGKTYQLVARYQPELSLWFISRINEEKITSEFAEKLSVSLGVFTGFLLLLFLLVRSVSLTEARTHKELLFQAQHDLVTQLPNKRYLRSNFDTWQRSARGTYSVIQIEFDNYKFLKDWFGEGIAESTLVGLAMRLSETLSKHDLLIKETGDRFLVLSALSDNQQLVQYAEKLHQSVSGFLNLYGESMRLKLTIGIASRTEEKLTLDEVMANANIATKDGVNSHRVITLFTAEKQNAFHRKVIIEQHLRKAVQANQGLYMVYQPQLSASGDIYGVEALVRWESETLGFIGPDTFIPIAESGGMMMDLGNLIINKTLRDMSSLALVREGNLQVSINFSIHQFLDPGFIDGLTALVNEYEVPTDKITLEITESLFVEDIEKIRPICDKLQSFGLKISLDDFGTGYSSLRMLNEVPVSELKIDRSFVQNIEECKKSRSLIKNIISIAKDIGISTVAEGVETSEHREILTGYDCNYLQGYYFARPLKLEQLKSFISKNRESKKSE